MPTIYRELIFNDGLPRDRPSSLGLSSRAIERLISAFDAADIELHSFMLARRGIVAAEGWWAPYGPERVHMLHSVTKALTATAIGIAVSEGRFSLSDKVVDFFPGRAPANASPALNHMRVRDLLTQSSGHDKGVSGSQWRHIQTSWIDEFLKIPVPHEPGTHFQYSSATSFMLSAILTKTTGLSMHDYLVPRLFDPLGMSSVRWDVGPEGINPGGNGASATTSDLLKLAILYQNGGVWNGQRILSEAWMEGMSISEDWRPYGYHWWVLPRTPGFFAFGAFGQYGFVFPEQEIALAITAAVPGSISRPDIGIPPLVWTHLPEIVSGDGDADADDRLARRMLRLELPPLSGQSTIPEANGFHGRFIADQNEDAITAIDVLESGDVCTLRIAIGTAVHTVHASLDGAPLESVTTLPGFGLHHGYEPALMKTSASARWTDANELVVQCRFYETAFCDLFRLKVDGDQLEFSRSVNVNGGSTARPLVSAVREIV